MNLRKDDQEGILDSIDQRAIILLREALDDGFCNYSKSRNKDADAHVDYTDCTRCNMLYDRVAASARAIIDHSSAEMPSLWYRITPNRRATDIFLDLGFAFRIKRTKRSRSGRTTGVLTRRQREILSPLLLPPGQKLLPYADMPAPEEERLWLTVAFDLDETEEYLEKVALGVEIRVGRRRRFLWRFPLEAPDAGVIATLSPLFADKILELRRQRSA